MKKLTIILFSVLFVAVAALFVLYFTGGKAKNEVETERAEIDPQGIVFVNIDTIIFNFEMFADRRNDLLNKQKSAEAELNSKGSQYERGIKDYQDKVNKGLVTRATAAQMEEALMKQQQDLVALRDQLQSDLIEEEQVMNRQIIDYITKFLEKNKKEYSYHFILGKSFGGPVLYSDTALDITYSVLEALNNQYRAERK